ncbi:hypothetical protein E2C01_049672 [Portunus trituberculatus]|uniref:Uncharacterized protein n=1 Tax=Portunus trituberculatus TaxID=210409 RepID=A0A5B7GEZ5_PORTR|nr:hypothetical protein [Portunus trituberculatus]
METLASTHGLEGGVGGSNGGGGAATAAMSRCDGPATSLPDPSATSAPPTTTPCCLTLSRSCIGASSCETVTVRWSMPPDCAASPHDWLGLYVAGEYCTHLICGVSAL